MSCFFAFNLLQCKDVESEIINNKFIRMVHSILEDTEKKENFIQVSLLLHLSVKRMYKTLMKIKCFHVSPLFLCLQHVFPVEYGSGYDAVLQSLAWEFLSRVEDLLPVPNLKEVCPHSKIA